MHSLLTGIQFLLLVVGVYYAYVAARSAEHADREGRRLGTFLARVIALEGGLEQLNKQHRKLAGAFHATRYQDELALTNNAPDNKQLLPACENWVTAQRDGPRSTAARCECAYCTERRAERDAFRTRVVPKTARAQGELAKVNSQQ